MAYIRSKKKYEESLKPEAYDFRWRSVTLDARQFLGVGDIWQ